MYLIEEALIDAEKRLKNVDRNDKRACKVALVTYRALQYLDAKPIDFDEIDFNLCPIYSSKIKTDDKFLTIDERKQLQRARAYRFRLCKLIDKYMKHKIKYKTLINELSDELFNATLEIQKMELSN